MSCIVGIDLSLTSTGIALVNRNGSTTLRTVKSKGKKDATVKQTAARIRDIADEVGRWVTADWNHIPALAVIEAPSYGSRTGSQHERGGLWWSVAILLSAHDVRLATVSPQGRAKYATGKGNAGKDEVLAAVIRRYPHADVTGNDVADALVLAAMGARHLGQPLEDDMPAANLTSMAGASWPT